MPEALFWSIAFTAVSAAFDGYQSLDELYHEVYRRSRHHPEKRRNLGLRQILANYSPN